MADNLGWALTMRTFDRSFVDSFCSRLSRIPEDAKPLWGAMNRGQMFAHLSQAIGYSLGELPRAKDEGNLFYHAVAAPLILNGFIRMPRNVEAPKMYAFDAPGEPLESVHARLEAFLDRMSEPHFNPLPHPLFGAIGAKGWGKLHIVHGDHHARQFAV
ncbi:MAG: hypothetical protein AMXMBFR84_34670 [Candidatus Hydrogenedentota bacterium]